MKNLLFGRAIYSIWAFGTILYFIILGSLVCIKNMYQQQTVNDPWTSFFLFLIPQVIWVALLLALVLWRKKLGFLIFASILSITGSVLAYYFFILRHEYDKDLFIMDTIGKGIWLFLSYFLYRYIKKEEALIVESKEFQDISLQIDATRSQFELESLIIAYKKSHKLPILFKKALHRRCIERATAIQ